LRALAMGVFFWMKQLNANTVIIIFIAGDVAEWLLCWLLARRQVKLRLSFTKYWQPYKKLLKESLPQLGTAIVGSAMARIDWILMGLMGMAIQLADYSFAYKMYELATLPLLVIGPLLIPRFARMYSQGEVNTTRFFTLLRLEMVIAAGTILILCILWLPVTEALNLSRYGAVNNSTILLLSASIPFLYLNNLLWTILFVKGKLRLIFYITLVIFLCNLVANLLLIPLYAGKGAAMAYLGAMMLQSMLLLYAVKIKHLLLYVLWLPLCVLCAAFAGWVAAYFYSNVVVALPVAMLLYLLLLLLSGAFRLKDVKFLPEAVKK
jgi:O-antigen/teichoic acid export membrane protein